MKMYRCYTFYHWGTRCGLVMMLVWIIYKAGGGGVQPGRGSTSHSIQVLSKHPIEDASSVNYGALFKDLATRNNSHFLMNYLRITDKPMVEEVLRLKTKDLVGEEIVKKYLEIISKPTQGVCQNLKRFGGNWWPDKTSLDGHRLVCLDDSRIWDGKDDCLIYSFGIGDDWSFEDGMSALGCRVTAHDPTVSYPATRGPNIKFHQLGLANTTGKHSHFGFPIDTLHRILIGNNHSQTVINYLKVDIEGSELSSMSGWLDSGALHHVQQLGMEIHLSDVPHSRFWCSWIGPALVHLIGYQESEVLCWYGEMLEVLQKLYRAGFRLVSSSKSVIPGFYFPISFTMLNVVFMRDNIWNCLEDSDQNKCSMSSLEKVPITFPRVIK